MAIIGTLSRIKSRFFENHLSEVFEYLQEATSENSHIKKRIFSRPLGAFAKVDLGQEVFALEQVFETKDRNNCFFESHLKYVDFQLVLSGSEQMEYVDISKMTASDKYNSEKDLIVYKDSKTSSKIIMGTNDLAVYFPEDVHMGLGWVHSQKSIVYKTVVKLPVKYADIF